MIEFIVIVESGADAETATKLAERVLVEKIDWLDNGQIQYQFQWSGLQENAKYSCWKDIKQIIDTAKQNLGFPTPRYLGHGKGKLKADGAVSIKILNLVRFLQKKTIRPIKAVLLIRDLDNQPQRREGMEEARSKHIHGQSKLDKLEIVIGTADRMREAWILNGFTPHNQKEEEILEEIKTQLSFDPCQEAYRLRSNSREEPDRIRNPKVVLDLLTGDSTLRQQQCWEETNLECLKQRGKNTGLTAYLDEIEQRIDSSYYLSS